MALKWLESWGLYDPDHMRQSLPLRWQGGVQCGGGLFAVKGRFGGLAVRMTANDLADSLTTPRLTPQKTWVVGFAWRPLSESLGGTLLKLVSRDGLEQASLRVLPGKPRTLCAYRGDGVQLVAYPDAWRAGEWQFIEMYVAIDRDKGLLEIRLDGRQSGATFRGNTRNSPAFDTACSVSFSGVTGGYDLGDLFVFDGMGSRNREFVPGAAYCAVVPLLSPNATLLSGSGKRSPHGRSVEGRPRLEEVAGVVHLAAARRLDTSGSPPEMSLVAGGRTLSMWKVPDESHFLSTVVQEASPAGSEWTADDLPSFLSDSQLNAPDGVEVGFVGAEVLGRVSADERWFYGDGISASLSGEGDFVRRECCEPKVDGTVWLRLKGATECLRHPHIENESRGYISLGGQASFQRLVNR